MLSFTSITWTSILVVPDLAGFPPSKAVRVSWTTGCFSLSKAFAAPTRQTRSPLHPCTSRRNKYSFALSLYAFTSFFPMSASLARATGNLDPVRLLSAMAMVCDCALNVGELSLTSKM
uniref:Secreted protein n=1 Tax=Denticeps clupeoides TaxID=299321 RepID=A0AAY4DJ04_9TELE